MEENYTLVSKIPLPPWALLYRQSTRKEVNAIMTTESQAIRTLTTKTLKDPPYILVVEDDPRWLEDVLAVLKKQGYAAVGAGTGTEALDIAERALPSGLFLDYWLKKEPGK